VYSDFSHILYILMQMTFSPLAYFIPACNIAVYCGGVVQVLLRYGRKLCRHCLLCDFEIFTLLCLICLRLGLDATSLDEGLLLFWRIVAPSSSMVQRSKESSPLPFRPLMMMMMILRNMRNHSPSDSALCLRRRVLSTTLVWKSGR